MVANNNKSGVALKQAMCAALGLLLIGSVSANQQTPVQQVNGQGLVSNEQVTYGPIETTDTLWKIAVAHRPDESVSNYQVMVALFKNNPKAFLRNDINKMIAGQYLRIPTLSEIREIAPYPYGENSPDVATLAKSENTNNAQTVSEPVDGDVDLRDTDAVLLSSQTDFVEVNTAGVSTEQTANNNNAIQNSASQKNTSEQNVADTLTSEQETQTTVTAATQEIIEPANTMAQDQQLTTSTSASDNAQDQEIKESLDAVDDQLTYLQYEVAKANEMQVKMDQKLTEQQKLLEQTQKREQRLLEQQRQLAKSQQGFFSNPWVIWICYLILAALVVALYVLVVRRKKQDVQGSALTQAPKALAQKSGSTTPAKPTRVQDVVNKVDMTQLQTDKTESTTQAANNGSTQSNQAVANAFATMDLSDTQDSKKPILSDDELLQSLVPPSAKADAEKPTEPLAEDDLNIDQIIDDMLDEDSKPVRLRSAKEGQPEKGNSNTQPADISAIGNNQAGVREIADYDDVEFDKLLQEISVESDTLNKSSNVTPLRRESTQPQQATSATAVQAEQREFVAVEQLLAESEGAEQFDEQKHSTQNIDVGLDEFDEFTTNVKHVNVDDDKHGVNAKLDLAQVYIEIGDLDNAAVILKSVMKLGNSAQQQQAQHLLYSLK